MGLFVGVVANNEADMCGRCAVAMVTWSLWMMRARRGRGASTKTAN
jgi:hypothetical protein